MPLDFNRNNSTIIGFSTILSFITRTSKDHKLLILIFGIILMFLFSLSFMIPSKAIVDVELMAEPNTVFKIYWDKKNGISEGYSEDKSSGIRTKKNKTSYKFRIDDLGTISTLRIDPSKTKAKIVIKTLYIEQIGYKPLKLSSIADFKQLTPLNHIKKIAYENKGISIISSGIDPQLEVNINPKFSFFKYYKDVLIACFVTVKKKRELLSIEFVSLAVLIADILIIFSLSSTLLMFFKPNISTFGEISVALGLIALGIIVSTIMILGAIFLLSWKTLFILHILLWIALQLVYVKSNYRLIVSTAFDNMRFILSSLLSPIRKVLVPRYYGPLYILNSLLLIVILFLLLYYFIPAAFTLPLNFDANDYRLSRIGYWLQEGHIWQFETNDIRQRILAINYDLVMLWIISFFSKGYPLVHLASFFGGLIACVAIYAFCKAIGFSMHWRLIAVLFWLGIPNSATQMLTSQSDLFTTGCLAGGIFFLYKALTVNRFYYYGLSGLGIGLAVGAKGTVFFWGPGLLFLYLFMVIAYRQTWKTFIQEMAIFVLILFTFGGFSYIQNFYYYDTPFGSVRKIKSIKKSKPSLDKSKPGKPKLSTYAVDTLKAKAYFWQIFEPSSNLPIIHSATNPLFVAVEGNLKKDFKTVKSSFVGRFDQGTRWIRAFRLNEDYLSFGLVSFSFLFIGGIFAFYIMLRHRDSLSIHISIMFISVLLYFIFYCHIADWTLHRYRYAVLVTPFIAVIATFFLSQLFTVKVNFINFIIIPIVSSVILYQAYMSFYIASNSLNHGWKSFISPSQTVNYINYWRDAEHLIKKFREKNNRLGLFLGKGSWSSLFFRQGPNINSKYIFSKRSLDINHQFFDEQQIDALITKRLSSVNVKDNFNVYRSAGDNLHALVRVSSRDELEPWAVTKNIWRDGWTTVKGSFPIGNWFKKQIGLFVINPSPLTRTVVLSTSLETKKRILPPHQRNREKITLQVKQYDKIKWKISPAFKSWKFLKTDDKRRLGIKMKIQRYQEEESN